MLHDESSFQDRYEDILQWLEFNLGRPEKAQAYNPNDALRLPPNWVVIEVGGRAMAGKDEIADHLLKQIKDTPEYARHFSVIKKDAWANELKEDVKRIFGFTDEQLRTQEGKRQVHPKWGITSRQAQQGHGSAMRQLVGRFWVTRLEDKYLNSISSYERHLIIVSDGRYVNELAPVANHPNGLTFHIVRAYQPEVTGGIKGHHSEGEWELPEAQKYINNVLINEGPAVAHSLEAVKADAWRKTSWFLSNILC